MKTALSFVTAFLLSIVTFLILPTIHFALTYLVVSCVSFSSHDTTSMVQIVIWFASIFLLGEFSIGFGIILGMMTFAGVIACLLD